MSGKGQGVRHPTMADDRAIAPDSAARVGARATMHWNAHDMP